MNSFWLDGVRVNRMPRASATATSILQTWLCRTGGSVLAILAATLSLQSAEIPLGHKDFYPSSQRPIGYNADGSITSALKTKE